MATDTEQSERAEPDVEAPMDGGLCRLDLPGVAELEDEEIVNPRRPRGDE